MIQHLTHSLSAALLGLALFTHSAQAEPIRFNGEWREQGFLRLYTNDYEQRGNILDVMSDGTVSLLWKPLEPSLHGATKARWSWSVAQGVPATDLAKKGGDDRNLALYFVFTSREVAQSNQVSRAARLLRNDDTYALVYVWGGDEARGAVLNSPYHPRLRTVTLQKAGLGEASEAVDLAADYRRAFGGAPAALVGIGVSADSDDTDTLINARVQDLRLD